MRTRYEQRRWGSAVVAAVASVCVHVLLIEAAMSGGTVSRPRMERRDGVGASAMYAEDDSRMTVIFLDSTGTASAPEDSMEALASSGKAADGPLLTIVSPELTLNVEIPREDEASDTTENPQDTTGDQAIRTMLFGRYMGQIHARIERAWLRPRTALPEDSFSCRLRVQQDRQGNVLEVTIQRCTADLDWQASLVRAIQRAEPLPAPPHPSVYADLLQLSFDSDTYRPDRSEQGFEPIVPELISATTTTVFEPEPAPLVGAEDRT